MDNAQYIGNESKCTIYWGDPITVDLGKITKISFNKDEYSMYSGNRVNGIWRVQYSNNSSYDGEMVNGKREGFGYLIHREKGEYHTKYRGLFHADDLVMGETLIVFDGVGFLKGEVDSGAFVRGKFEHSNGDIQSGEWKKGIQHGQCLLNLASKDICWKGQFINGMPNGPCVMSRPSSDLIQFRGNFSDPGNASGDLFVWENHEWVWDCSADLVDGVVVPHKNSATTISDTKSPGVREHFAPEHLMSFEEKQCLEQ